MINVSSVLIKVIEKAWLHSTPKPNCEFLVLSYANANVGVGFESRAFLFDRRVPPIKVITDYTVGFRQCLTLAARLHLVESLEWFTTLVCLGTGVVIPLGIVVVILGPAAVIGLGVVAGRAVSSSLVVRGLGGNSSETGATRRETYFRVYSIWILLKSREKKKKRKTYLKKRRSVGGSMSCLLKACTAANDCWSWNYFSSSSHPMKGSIKEIPVATR